MSDLRDCTQEAEIAACFPLMRQLRPQLADAEELVARWRRQSADGYRVLAVWPDDRPVALAGWRLSENLIYGPFLYVDDLVTDEAARGQGHGARLLEHLRSMAREAGCVRLVLDTALDNVLGHRFYYRNGLLARGLRFGIPVA